MTTRSTRRTFLKHTLGAGLGTAIAPAVVSAKSPNGKLQHASIGIGGMGGADLRQFGSNPDVELVAICDIDTVRLAAAAEKFPRARRYQHWRELLEAESDKIDSVNVSTPDHMHAPPPFHPSAPVQRRLQRPRAKSKFLAVKKDLGKADWESTLSCHENRA